MKSEPKLLYNKENVFAFRLNFIQGVHFKTSHLEFLNYINTFKAKIDLHF